MVGEEKVVVTWECKQKEGSSDGGMGGEGMSQVMVVEVWSGGREVVVRMQRMGEEGDCGNVEERGQWWG